MNKLARRFCLQTTEIEFYNRWSMKLVLKSPSTMDKGHGLHLKRLVLELIAKAEKISSCESLEMDPCFETSIR